MVSMPESLGSSRFMPISEPPLLAHPSTSSQSNSRTAPRWLVAMMTSETSEAVVNGNGGVASSQAVCYSCSSCSINTTSWSTNVDNSNSHVLCGVSITSK
jgi:hypothetical protein